MGSPLHLSRDQADVWARAEASGWEVACEGPPTDPTALLRLARPDRSIVAAFSHDGALLHSSASWLGRAGTEFDLPTTLVLMEEFGAAGEAGGAEPYGSDPPPPRAAASTAGLHMEGAQPEETPPGEASTTAGISVPEPAELRSAWGPWPLVVIAVLVVCVLVFLIGRVFSW
jgi:hypothetical protein